MAEAKAKAGAEIKARNFNWRKEMSEERKVHCKKLGKELPGLEKPPFPGEMGEKIYNSISKEAWDSWANDMQVKVLNEYRLNMGNADDYQVLVNQMLAFLNLSDDAVVEVENAERGRGESG